MAPVPKSVQLSKLTLPFQTKLVASKPVTLVSKTNFSGEVVGYSPVVSVLKLKPVLDKISTFLTSSTTFPIFSIPSSTCPTVRPPIFPLS